MFFSRKGTFQTSEVRLICTIFFFANRCASEIGADVLLLGCNLLRRNTPKVLLVPCYGPIFASVLFAAPDRPMRREAHDQDLH